MGRDLIFGCMVKLTDCSSHKLLGIFELTMLYKLLSFSITLSSLLKFHHFKLFTTLSLVFLDARVCLCLLIFKLAFLKQKLDIQVSCFYVVI